MQDQDTQNIEDIFNSKQKRKELRDNPKLVLSQYNFNNDNDIEYNVISNKKDVIYLVIPNKEEIDNFLSQINAAKLVNISSSSTLGSAGSISSYSCPSTLASLGSLGSAGTISP